MKCINFYSCERILCIGYTKNSRNILDSENILLQLYIFATFIEYQLQENSQKHPATIYVFYKTIPFMVMFCSALSIQMTIVVENHCQQFFPMV